MKLRTIRFFKDETECKQSDPRLEYADCVLITFQSKKKGKRIDTVTKRALGNSIFLAVGSSGQMNLKLFRNK